MRNSTLTPLPRPPLLLAIIVSVLIPFLTSCTALRTLLPGGPVIADAEWHGVKSGDVVSIVGALDPRAGNVATLLLALGANDPVGVLLPVTLIGETEPRWVLCTEKLAVKCGQIPLNAKVHFAGSPLGPGILWKPSRLTADDFDD